MNKLPLDGRALSQKIEQAKKLLTENGYVISGPFYSKEELTNLESKNYPKSLVRYFYDKIERKTKNLRFIYSGDFKRDLHIARLLLDSRTETGIGEKQAFLQCCEIIDCLIDNQELLGITRPITSMSVLDQKEATSWITEKVLDYLNGLNSSANKLEEQEWFDYIYCLQEEEITDK